MKELIIACSMMEDEIHLAMKETGYSSPIVWIPRALHEYPEKLRTELNTQLLTADADTILLVFGLCGNALDGVVSPHARLVVPKFDDCIRMLLSCEEGSRYTGDPRSLYYTGGWVRSEKFLLHEYRKFAERRGEKKAACAYGAMFANYREIRMIDTGAYQMEDYRRIVEETAGVLKLGCQRECGSVRVLKKLFAHDWDEEFLIFPPNTQIRQEQFLHEGKKAEID